jgi:hypothetical protein
VSERPALLVRTDLPIRKLRIPTGNDGVIPGDVHESIGAGRSRWIPIEPALHDFVANRYAKTGRWTDALKILANVTRPGATPPGFFMESLASLYFALGNKDDGFKTLNKMFDEHQIGVEIAKVYPILDDVRCDPRMAALVAGLENSRRPLNGIQARDFQ